MIYPDSIEVNGRRFFVSYEKSLKSSSTVRIRNRKVVLKLSRFAFGKQRDEIVEKFLKWAEKKLSGISCSDFIEPDYRDGGRIVTHNKVYELFIHLRDRKNNRVIMDGGVIEVFLKKTIAEKCDVNRRGGGLVDDDIYVDDGICQEIVKELVEKAIIKDQIPYLKEVVEELNELYFKEKYNLVRFKRMNSRFGSCSARRNINIAFRLLYAPREVFRYVCIHELSHLKQMNHSKKFWALVAEAMPEYKKFEKWLRESGFALG